MFLISENLGNIISCDIRPAQIKYTDHLAISIKIYHSSNTKGKGIWKINNSLLDEVEYKSMVRNVIRELKEEQAALDLGKSQFWDYCKVIIKNRTIHYCRNRSKNISENISQLEKNLVNLQTEHVQNPQEILKERISELEGNLELFLRGKSQRSPGKI
ncbi:hypothetical protein CI610_03461 [invertebrate metagenome]|uniref:Uncharacterized protein n=1 Tax=invertebrate metagenome TaxID=1711999 RepID=A0A2H9T340_9ZZZZ